MFSKNMFQHTFKEKPLSGGVPFCPTTRAGFSDILPNKDNTKYTALTHAKKGSKTYNEAVNKRGYIPISNEREKHLNRQFQLREFYQNGEQKNPVTRNLKLYGDMLPQDRSLLDDFQKGLLTQSLELDTVLGDAVRGGQNEFEELMELRQQIQSSLPANISRELRERILNQATDNYFKDFQRRNPETGNVMSNPIQQLRDRASVNRSSVDDRVIDDIFRGIRNRAKGDAPVRPDVTFQDDEVFNSTAQVQTGQSIPRVKKEDFTRRPTPFVLDVDTLIRGREQLTSVPQDDNRKNIPKRLDDLFLTPDVIEKQRKKLKKAPKKLTSFVIEGTTDGSFETADEGTPPKPQTPKPKTTSPSLKKQKNIPSLRMQKNATPQQIQKYMEDFEKRRERVRTGPLTLRDLPKTRKGKPDERSKQFKEWRDQQRDEMMDEDEFMLRPRRADQSVRARKYSKPIKSSTKTKKGN